LWNSKRNRQTLRGIEAGGDELGRDSFVSLYDRVTIEADRDGGLITKLPTTRKIADPQSSDSTGQRDIHPLYVETSLSRRRRLGEEPSAANFFVHPNLRFNQILKN